MAKFGFLDVLEEVLEKGSTYDFEMNWDKRKIGRASCRERVYVLV